MKSIVRGKIKLEHNRRRERKKRDVTSVFLYYYAVLVRRGGNEVDVKHPKTKPTEDGRCNERKPSHTYTLLSNLKKKVKNPILTCYQKKTGVAEGLINGPSPHRLSVLDGELRPLAAPRDGFLGGKGDS